MAEYLTSFNAKSLLAAWEDAGHITPEGRRKLGAFIFSRSQEEELPLYLRVLVGFGAFIATIFLMGFLSLAKVVNFDSAPEMFAWGVLFIAGAVLLARRAAATSIILHSFMMQVSFCCIGAGKILAVMGVVRCFGGGHHHEEWSATLALAAITAATWPFYRMSIDRYLSSAAVLLMILFNIADDYDLESGRQFLLDGFFLVQLLGAGYVFTHGKVTRDVAPLGYAMTTSLCATVGLFAMHMKLGWGAHALMLSPVFVNGALAAALIALIGWAAGDMRRLEREPLMLAALGAALLGTLSAPGIILSIGLMVLGYARHDRLLILAGALLMPWFLWCYYGNLDVTLMAKSGILFCSGMVLLAGRLYMRARNLDAAPAAKETAS